jgi:hypothetical protein
MSYNGWGMIILYLSLRYRCQDIPEKEVDAFAFPDLVGRTSNDSQSHYRSLIMTPAPPTLFVSFPAFIHRFPFTLFSR